MIICCQACGRTFEDGKPEKYHGSHRKFCSECIAVRKHAWGKAHDAQQSAETRRKNVDKRERALLDDIRAADAAGMSYGQYMARKNLEKISKRA